MSNDAIIKGNDGKRKKKTVIITILLLVVIGIIVTIVTRNLKEKSDGNKIYVSSVADISGYGSMGTETKFTGVVEAQAPVVINYDSNKSIKTCFVKVGDEVQVGTQLFEYDTDEINNNIEEAQLEIDKLNLEITSNQQQITELQAEKAAAPTEEQLSYTMQIQSLTAEITSSQYDVKTKSADLQKLKDSLGTSIVTSTAAGIVKSIGEDTSSKDYDYDDSSSSSENTPYISIQPMGDYQIKGVLNELNKDVLTNGTAVIINSRISDDVAIKGTVSKIDFNNTVNNNSDSYYYDEDEGSAGESGSKWNFFVTFEKTDDLVLGQHVFIEPDYGQTEDKEGLWLSEFYLASNDDDSFYVWKEKDGKLVKQSLTLGKYDSEEMTYQILEGLNIDDFIAYPDDNLSEGMTTTHSIDEATPTDDEESFDEDMDDGDFDDADFDVDDIDDTDDLDDIDDGDLDDLGDADDVDDIDDSIDSENARIDISDDAIEVPKGVVGDSAIDNSNAANLDNSLNKEDAQ